MREKQAFVALGALHFPDIYKKYYCNKVENLINIIFAMLIISSEEEKESY